jgi:hypothetical protein
MYLLYVQFVISFFTYIYVASTVVVFPDFKNNHKCFPVPKWHSSFIQTEKICCLGSATTRCLLAARNCNVIYELGQCNRSNIKQQHYPKCSLPISLPTSSVNCRPIEVSYTFLSRNRSGADYAFISTSMGFHNVSITATRRKVHDGSWRYCNPSGAMF